MAARLVFEDVGFLGLWIEADPGAWQVENSSQRASILHVATGARVRCIGLDANRAHGLRPAAVLMDEPAQWPASQGERFYRALETSGARFRCAGGCDRDPAGRRGHWFEGLLRGGADVSMVHAADRRGPWVLGVDLSGGAAMTGVAGYWIETGRLEAWAAFPEEPSLVERGRLDGVDALYVDMAKRGELSFPWFRF